MSNLDDDICDALINQTIEELGDEVIEAIRADERQMIIDFIRQEEWLYECGEEIAEAIEEMQHYEDEEIH